MGVASIVLVWVGFVLLMVGIVFTFRFNTFLGVLTMLAGAYMHITGVNKAIREIVKQRRPK